MDLDENKTTETQIIELIDSLNGLAMYNDKGYLFADHDESQQQLTRNSHRTYLDRFIEKYKIKLSKEAISILTDEKLIFDGNGDYAQRLKKLMMNDKIVKRVNS